MQIYPQVIFIAVIRFWMSYFGKVLRRYCIDSYDGFLPNKEYYLLYLFVVLSVSESVSEEKTV